MLMISCHVFCFVQRGLLWFTTNEEATSEGRGSEDAGTVPQGRGSLFSGGRGSEGYPAEDGCGPSDTRLAQTEVS